MEADDKDLLINDLHYGQGPFSDSSLKRRSASFDAAFSKKRRGLLKMKKKFMALVLGLAVFPTVYIYRLYVPFEEVKQ